MPTTGGQPALDMRPARDDDALRRVLEDARGALLLVTRTRLPLPGLALAAGLAWLRSALGRSLPVRRPLVPDGTRHPRGGIGFGRSPRGGVSGPPTCSRWGRGDRQRVFAVGGRVVVRVVHGTFRTGVWSGVLVLSGSVRRSAGCGFELGLELADDSPDAVTGDGVAGGAQSVLHPVASDAAGLLVDAAGVLEDDLVGGAGFAGVAFFPAACFRSRLPDTPPELLPVSGRLFSISARAGSPGAGRAGCGRAAGGTSSSPGSDGCGRAVSSARGSGSRRAGRGRLSPDPRAVYEAGTTQRGGSVMEARSRACLRVASLRSSSSSWSGSPSTSARSRALCRRSVRRRCRRFLDVLPPVASARRIRATASLSARSRMSRAASASWSAMPRRASRRSRAWRTRTADRLREAASGARWRSSMPMARCHSIAAMTGPTKARTVPPTSPDSA